MHRRGLLKAMAGAVVTLACRDQLPSLDVSDTQLKPPSGQMTELPIIIKEPWFYFVCPCEHKMELGGGYHSVICGALCGRHFQVDVAAFPFTEESVTVWLYPDILPESTMKKFREHRAQVVGGEHGD